MRNGGHFTIINDGSKEILNSAFGSYYKYFVTVSGKYTYTLKIALTLRSYSNLSIDV